ncbi:MAG: acyl carrier protein [Bacteroidia bacterium]|nr:acyl carrier protein [Bacteroidia bacterium]
MKPEEITEKLKKIMKAYLEEGIDLENITSDTDLINDLKINSMHLVDIILDLEDEFNIEISDDDAEQMLTVGKSIEVIQAQLAK